MGDGLSVTQIVPFVNGLNTSLTQFGIKVNPSLLVRSSIYELDVRHTLTSYLHLLDCTWSDSCPSSVALPSTVYMQPEKRSLES